jgi:hypothetical protein
VAAFLIGRGAALDAHAAARLGWFQELQDLVTANPGVVAALGAHGQTPLHFASTIEMAQYLLERGGVNGCSRISSTNPHRHSTCCACCRDVIIAATARISLAIWWPGGCRTDILMAAALGDVALVRSHLEADPACIRMCVSEEYFPKRDARRGGSIYTWIFGPRRTAHLISRDFGHDEVFRLVMEHSPEELKPARACELGDEDTFGALMARQPSLSEVLSDDDRRRLPDAAQNNNTNAVRLMLSAEAGRATRWASTA